MKDPNLSELVRTCIRCWLYLVPQAFLGIHLFDMFMRRKNSIKPLICLLYTSPSPRDCS